MKDGIQQYNEHCKCGHDRCSHFEKRWSCLCMGCQCRAYKNQHEKDPPVVHEYALNTPVITSRIKTDPFPPDFDPGSDPWGI